MNKNYSKIDDFFKDFKHCIICGQECKQQITGSVGSIEQRLPHVVVESNLTKSRTVKFRMNKNSVIELSKICFNFELDFNKGFLNLESFCNSNPDHDYWVFTSYLKIKQIINNKYKLQLFTKNYESISDSKYNVCNFYEQNGGYTVFYNNDGEYIMKTSLLDLSKINIEKTLLLM